MVLERRAEGDEGGTTLQDQLAALGYVEEVTDEIDASQRGVIVHDRPVPRRA